MVLLNTVGGQRFIIGLDADARYIGGTDRAIVVECQRMPINFPPHGINGVTIKFKDQPIAQRRNEMMQIALTNPMAQQIMGVEGVAALLREQAKTLDMNADRIVPSPEIAKARAMVAQAQAMIQQAQMAQQGMLMQPPPGQGGSPQAGPTTDSGQRLEDGTPITDTFSPMRTS